MAAASVLRRILRHDRLHAGSIWCGCELAGKCHRRPIAGKKPLELITVYLTFPFGEKAFELTSTAQGGLIMAMGCCLYLATGMVLGVPMYLALAKICGESASLGRRLLVASVLSLLLWAINFYGILSWLQPVLLGGNWITDPTILPVWVRDRHAPRLRLDAGLAVSVGTVYAVPSQRQRHLKRSFNIGIRETHMMSTADAPDRIPAMPRPRHDELVDERLVAWYFLAALAFFFISMLGGFLMALQLVRHNPLHGIELFSPGRWRMVHTNAIAYGFLANAFLGVLHWAVPRLTLRPVLDRRLS